MKIYDISIHALRGEGDTFYRTTSDGVKNFYPRPPWGGRHAAQGGNGLLGGFLSTPSVGRATPVHLRNHRERAISIHALRGEGDSACTAVGSLDAISIHALRGEGDRFGSSAAIPTYYFYPRPPWGGRRPIARHSSRGKIISIHALRGEGDCKSA